MEGESHPETLRRKNLFATSRLPNLDVGLAKLKKAAGLPRGFCEVFT